MNRKNQNGVSLIAAVFIIVVLAFMGVMFLTMVNTGSLTAVNDIQSAQALYVAEGGMESAVASLNTPTIASRVTCSGVTGNANLTSEPLGQGQFTVIGTSVYPAAPATLNGAITNATTTINVNSTSGYATSGRIMIDRELIDYSSITPGIAFTNVVRARDGTFASAHVNGANIGQDQCTITSTGGVPTIAAPAAQRQVTEGVQLQEGWIVGAGGLPNNNINGAFCTNAANCWAVGAGGVILHWDGTFWDQAVSPTVNALNEINCVNADPNNCWAVGASNGARPTILRWNTTCNGLGVPTGVWNDCTSAPYVPGRNVNLNSVFMVSATDGWAVGTSDGTRATAFRWNIPCGGGAGNGHWNDCSALPYVQNKNVNLNSVFMISATDGWAVGTRFGTRQTVFRWNIPCAGGAGNGNWNDCTSAPYVPIRNNVDLSSVFMVSATDGWAVGTSDGTRPTAFRWNIPCAGGAGNGNWNDCSALPYVPNVNQALNAVVCSAANDCWAFGNNGTIMHWNGTAWALQQQATATLLRWNGISWTEASGGLPVGITNLNSISMLSYADGGVVGNSSNPGTNRATLSRWGGVSWTDLTATLPANANQNLNSIYMVSSTDGFAVGNNGAGGGGTCTTNQPRMLRWDGAAWTCLATALTTPADLLSVFMLDPNYDGKAEDGWAFGGNWATQMRWNIPCNGIGAGTNTWHDCTAYNHNYVPINSVFMVSQTFGWAVGNVGASTAGSCNNGQPTLIYWDSPSGWWLCPAVYPATAANLYSVFLVSTTDGWAVGASNGARPAVFRWDTPCGGGALTIPPVWNDCTNATYVPAINQQLNSVYCVDANDCWAVGNAGLILHWNGSTWSQVQAGLTTSNLRGVYVIGPEQRPQAAWQDLVN